LQARCPARPGGNHRTRCFPVTALAQHPIAGSWIQTDRCNYWACCR
jgi:hypothetical protein